MGPSAEPFQTRVLETATTFANETDGTWLMANWVNAGGKPDLVFLKTSNTPNGHVEVHIASGASVYQTRVLETATTFANETDGTWLMANWVNPGGKPDLVFIKTNNTPSGRVEVHIASAASNYQTRVLQTATTFANETDGTWLMASWVSPGDEPDLVFVKTNNTPNGHVEVHVASGAETASLAFTMQPQTESNWCWSAVATSVSLYFNPQSAWTQCSLANAQLGQTTCCQNGGTAACNVAWYLDRALTGTGNLDHWQGSTESFATTAQQVAGGNPLGVRIGWSGGGGHFVAVTGYDAQDQMLIVHDPIYGTSSLPYATFATNYQGSGTWTDSYFTKAG